MNRRFSSLFVVFCWLLIGPASGWAQGKCGYLEEGDSSIWISADFGAGVSAPVPTSTGMAVKLPAAGFGGGIRLHLPRRFSAGLGVFHKYYTASDSTYHWGKYTDILVRWSVAAIMNRHFQWDFSLLAGVSYIVIQFMDIDPENPKYAKQNGVAVLVGPVKQSAIYAFSSGGSTRLSFFPVDALGIFLEAMVLFSYQPDLLMEWGPLSLSAMGGLELHL